MVALATIGACFGTLAIACCVLFFTMIWKLNDELKDAKHELSRIKESFAEGLRELQDQAAMPDETGMWLPRTDPATLNTAYVKQREMSAQAPATSSLAEIDNLMEALSNAQGRN